MGAVLLAPRIARQVAQGDLGDDLWWTDSLAPPPPPTSTVIRD